MCGQGDRKYFFAFTWEDDEFTWTVIPQGCTKTPTYFSRILKGDVNDAEIPRNSDMRMIYFYVLGHIRLLRGHHLPVTAAIQGHRVSKDQLRFLLPQVKYLGHLIPKYRLLINPERLRGGISFSLPKTNRKRHRGSPSLTRYRHD